MKPTTRDECSQIRRRLLATDAGGEVLDAAEEEHLVQCDSCRAIAADVAALRDAGRQHVQQSITPAMRESVLSALSPAIAALATKRAQQANKRGLSASPWLWLSLGTGVAAAVAIMVVLTTEDEKIAGGAALPRVLARTGAVEGASAGLARPGEPVRTGTDGVVRYAFAENKAVMLPLSRLRWRRPAGRGSATTALDLDTGSFVAQVDPRHAADATPLLVHTPHGRVSVSGTLLEVDVRADSLRVAVEHGEVVVDPVKDSSLRVHRGEVITLTAAGVSRTALSAAEGAAMRGWFENEKGTPADQPEPPNAVAQSALADEPGHPAATPARRQPTRRSATQDLHRTAVERVQETAAAGACAEAETLARTTLAGAPAPSQAQALVSVADCHLAAGAPEQALRLYAAAGAQFPKTAAGQNATYEAGRLAMELGQAKQARRAFQEYVARYPRGVLLGEAVFRLCSLAVDDRRFDEALRCVGRYRREQPNGPRSTDTYFIEATALREGSADCRGALIAYETYLARGGERAAQARQWSAWCKARLR